MTSTPPASATTTNETSLQRPRAHVRALLFLGAAIVAGLLGFAVYAKFTTQRPEPTDYMGWAQLAGEAIAAVMIVLLHRKCWAWGFIALIFAAFTGYTMHRLLGGAQSCGCFGKFSVAPPITITIDALVVAMSLGAASALGMARGWTWVISALLLPAAIGGGLYGASLPTPADFKPGSAFERVWNERQSNRAPRFEDEPEATPDEQAPALSPESQAPTAPDTDPAEFDPISMRAPDVLLLVPLVQDEFLGGEETSAWLTRLGEAASESSEAAWLIFVYDPNCDVCQKFLPFYTGYEQASADDALLRVVTVQKGDLTKFGIEDWAWAHSPTTLLVHRGEIIHEWGGEDTPIPGAIRGRMEAEGAAFFESMKATYKPLE